MGLFSREPKPHVTYEVSEKYKKLRMFLIIVLLAIGVVAITTGIVALLNTAPGWQEVTVSTQERNCGANFIFQYHFSDAGASATELNKKVNSVYDAAAVKAYWLFTPDEASEEYKNIYYINHHPDEVITVDPVLYQAFQKLEAAGNRYLYLGPAYAEYNSLFFNQDNHQVQELDPAVNEENRAYVETVAGFALDETHVNLELLGNNQVKLTLSQAYKDFAKAYEIDCFIDFHYMANAFIVDYFAQELIAEGLTHGYIVSVDGYTRNLWNGGDTFQMNLFDLKDTTIYPVGTFGYTGPMSIVALRDFPIAASDVYYREGADKTILHPYLSLQTGKPKASTHALVGTSKTASCADILLQLQPLYIADSLSASDLTALKAEDIQCIWFENSSICYVGEGFTFSNLFTDGNITYQPVKQG